MSSVPERESSRNNEFDIDQAICVVPAKTSVLAYIDRDTGDLWISTSDAGLRCDAEFRIAADDVVDFIDGLTELVGWPSVGKPAPAAKPAPKVRTSNAEGASQSVTRDAEAVTPDQEQPTLDWSAA